MEWVGTALAAFGLLWAAAFGFAHVRAVGKAKAAESWPVAAGTVIGSEVREEESSDRDGGSTTWYNPVVRYRYSVGGREIEGTRLRYGNPRSASRKKAVAALLPYAPGSTITVRYDPANPEESVLETRRPGPTYLFMAAMGLLFVGFGLFWNSLA